jgi:hypothetical protein
MSKMMKQVSLRKVNHCPKFDGNELTQLTVRISKASAEEIVGGEITFDGNLIPNGFVFKENRHFLLQVEEETENDCWNMVNDIMNGAA